MIKRGLTSNQYGIAHLVIILAVVAFAVIGFGGYYVIKNADKDKPNTGQTSSKIESTQDVQNAAKSLDADANDPELDPSQLDSDINDLL